MEWTAEKRENFLRDCRSKILDFKKIKKKKEKIKKLSKVMYRKNTIKIVPISKIEVKAWQ